MRLIKVRRRLWKVILAFQEGQEIPPLDDTKDEYSPGDELLQDFNIRNIRR
jgi:hypothetical protein